MGVVDVGVVVVWTEVVEDIGMVYAQACRISRIVA